MGLASADFITDTGEIFGRQTDNIATAKIELVTLFI
jgi:hypothetical protein